MSDIIEAVQLHDVGSELVQLFELELDSGTLYFHPGLSGSLTEITFDGNTYQALPIEVQGVDIAADGAINRPVLTVANVLATFSSSLGGLQNKDLIGTRVVVRSTLANQLATSPPVEFPRKVFIIDRISGEDNTAVTFELAAPFDLANITIPGRTIAGKYCSWVYQGARRTPASGGCVWNTDSTIQIDGVTYKAYFDENDTPIIPDGESITGVSFLNYTVYSALTPYVIGDYVEFNNTIWKCVRNSTGNDPDPVSVYWIRADVCGKKLASCKARFQFIPDVNGNSAVDSGELDLDTRVSLPFGAFPGSRKFR